VFLDTREIAPGAPFPDELAAAVAAARVVVVFADPAYFSRPWCVRELEAALGPEGEGRQVLVVLPPAADADALLLHLPPSLARRAWPQADQTEAIAGMVERALDGTLGRDLALPAESPLRPEGVTPPATWRATQRTAVSTAPDSLGPRLVGREETLWTLFRALETRRAGGPPRSVLLHGGAGAGKSQLAAEYLHRAGPRHYDAACWLDADVAPQDWASQVAAALQLVEAGPRLLWVVDNVPEPQAGTPAAPLSHWCPAVGRVSLLLTSRRPQVHGCDEVVPLDVLTPGEAVRLLTQPAVDRRWLPDGDWGAIARWVGGLPLALRILQAGLADGSLAPTALRAAVDAQEPAAAVDQGLDLLAETLPPGALRGVSDALGASLDALAGQPGARTALAALAQLRPWPLPEGLIDLVAGAPERAVLARRGWLTSATTAEGVRTWRLHRVAASFVRGRLPAFEGEEALLERLSAAVADARIDPRAERELGKHLMQIAGPLVARINAAGAACPPALIEAGRRFGRAAAFFRLGDRAWRGFRYVGAGWAHMFNAGPAVAARAQEVLAGGDAAEAAALPHMMQTLGRDPQVCAVLATLLADPRDDVRWQALVHASAYASSHVLVAFWNALAAEPNDAVRQNAAPQLHGLMAAPDAPLRTLLSHVAASLRVPSPAVRALAASALGQAIEALGEDGAAGGFTDEGLRKALIVRSAEETEPEVWSAIGRALGVRHHPPSWEALAEDYAAAADAGTPERPLAVLIAYLRAVEAPRDRPSGRHVIDDEDGRASLEIGMGGTGTPQPTLWYPILGRAVLADGTGDDRALAALHEGSGGAQALGQAVEQLFYDHHVPAAVVTVAERFLRLVPGDVHAYWWRGMAREDLGETEGALADFETMADRAPQFGYAFKRIARLRLARGEPDLARAALVRAQALIPADPEVVELAARLG
jgi:hypothetical protein